MSKQEFFMGFNKLAVYYAFMANDTELLKAQADIYYEYLKHLSFDEWAFAVDMTIKERTYQSMPKIAELLAMINGNPEERAINAYNQAIDAMGQIGVYHSVRFEDEAIMIAIAAMGGWVAFGDIEVGNSPMAIAKRKEFISIYSANRNRKFKLSHLVGLAERQNGAKSEHNRYTLITSSGEIREVERKKVALLSDEQKAFNALLANSQIAKALSKCAKNV